MPHMDRPRSRSLQSRGRAKGSRSSSAAPMPNRRLLTRGCAVPAENSCAIASWFCLVNTGRYRHQRVVQVVQVFRVAREVVASRVQAGGQASDNPVLYGALKVDDDIAAEDGVEKLVDTPVGLAQVDAPEADHAPVIMFLM